MDPSFRFIRSPRKQKSSKAPGSHWLRRLSIGLLIFACLAMFTKPALAQGPIPTPEGDERPPEAPERVDIEPTAQDEEIEERLVSILEATGWFVNPGVEVREGVVFMTGRTESEEYKDWAENLAGNTQDVAAVVNQIEIIQPSVWDIEPAINGLSELWRGLLRAIPLIVFSLLILVVTLFAARYSVAAARASLKNRLPSPLLLRSTARAVGLIVFLMGLYVIFQVAGLTSVALTIMGGTGLLGLVLGIAFQDITENFLASFLLSIQSPFKTGDLVDIGGHTGFVQALTTRVTVLMTQDGNHVQIPNGTVYKSTIQNFTSNPNRRLDFTVGIGFEDSISEAQEVALWVLEQHPAVLTTPEPWVLVENLGSATVNLRVYFWMDGHKHSWLKVKSSVIRLVKRAFLKEGISMPDEAREMLFPEGIQVHMIEAKENGQEVTPMPRTKPQTAEESGSVSTDAEDGLSSDAGEIEEQARRSRTPEEGENLLNPSGSNGS
jgi:small conductance mechanosensitive channel